MACPTHKPAHSANHNPSGNGAKRPTQARQQALPYGCSANHPRLRRNRMTKQALDGLPALLPIPRAAKILGLSRG
jgi:hypothetical protein